MARHLVETGGPCYGAFSRWFPRRSVLSAAWLDYCGKKRQGTTRRASGVGKTDNAPIVASILAVFFCA